jgi:hypothetical protein
MKIDILKLKDTDDVWSDEMYYTIKGLRDAVINNFYDNWDKSPITKQEIIESDEKMFEYLTSFKYDIETILTITENDLP